MKPLEKMTKKELIELVRKMEADWMNNPVNQQKHIYTTYDLMDAVRQEFWDTYGIDHEK